MNLSESDTRTLPSVRAAALVLGVCCLSLICGCGGDAHPLAPVWGRITLDGEALADASVGFEPVRVGDAVSAGPGAYGSTDAEGRFRLETPDRRAGATVGKNRVWVRTLRASRGRDGDTMLAAQERIPARYNSKTELTFDVPAEGTEAADFALVSD
jgi:hypothetical protein